jgi:pantoate--beta-alanine ligase
LRLRETDGLAMSSRNLNLPREAREIAPHFHQALIKASSTVEAQELLESDGFVIDYIEDIGSRRFGAVKIGGVRLIDNVER